MINRKFHKKTNYGFMRCVMLLLSLALIFLCFAVVSYAANEDPETENSTEAPTEVPTEAPTEVSTETLTEATTEASTEAEDAPPLFYTLDLSKSYKVKIDGKTEEVFLKQILMDLNNDGKCNTSDARRLLRIAVNIENYDGELSYADFDADGKITTSDARLLLRSVVNIDVFYATEAGVIPKGLLENTDGKKMYFGSGGALKTGFAEIGGDTYYFNSDAEMQTGKITISGKTYDFDDEGRAYSGFSTKDGETYYYEAGLLKTGWLYSGLDMFYFNSDGKMARNTTMGDFTFDANGHPSASLVNSETLQWQLRQILKANGAKSADIYNYVHNNYKYKIADKEAVDLMVIYMINNKRGSCYHYAHLTQYLLEAAGYESMVLVGNGFNAPEHDWVLIKINGAWRHIDAQKGTYMLTDAQMKEKGYSWTYSNYPEAV